MCKLNSGSVLVYKFDGLCVLLHKRFVQQLLLQFSTDFYEIWFFIIPNIVSDETTKKKILESEEKSRIFWQQTFYNWRAVFYKKKL